MHNHFGLISRVLFVISGCLLMLGSAWAAQTMAQQVAVENPYIRAMPPGQTNSAIFMHIKNRAQQPVFLVGARSPIAQRIELHTHQMQGGLMKMRPVDKIEVPMLGQVALRPGGLHLMVFGLTQTLKADDAVALILQFADGSELDLPLTVRSF